MLTDVLTGWTAETLGGLTVLTAAAVGGWLRRRRTAARPDAAPAHAVIQPNNSKATLGTMLGEIKNARHKLGTAITTPRGDPIAPVEAMMRALWEGQTSRHGAQSATVPETLEAARAGVHLAAALVRWFVSGAVIRTP
ncbi:hypothetical protein [Streptomyces sp. NPDC054849]